MDNYDNPHAFMRQPTNQRLRDELAHEKDPNCDHRDLVVYPMKLQARVKGVYYFSEEVRLKSMFAHEEAGCEHLLEPDLFTGFYTPEQVTTLPTCDLAC